MRFSKITIFTMLLCAWNYSQQKRSIPSFSKTKVDFFGVISSSLDPYQREVLESRLEDLMSSDPELEMADWTGHLKSILEGTHGELPTVNSIHHVLPVGDYDYGILYSIEKEDEDYIAKLYLYRGSKDPTPEGTVHLWSGIDANLRKGGLPLYKLLRRQFTLSGSSLTPEVLMELKIPIYEATLVYQDEIIFKDSVHRLYKNSHLRLSPNAQPYAVRGSDFTLILFPGSHYYFDSASSAHLVRGEFGILSIGRSFYLQTPTALGKIENGIALFTHLDKTHVLPFAGNLRITPREKIEWRDSVSTPVHVGEFLMEDSPIPDSIMVLKFQTFLPYLTKSMMKKFKVRQELVQAQAILSLGDRILLRGESERSYYGDEFENMGIPAEALWLDGEIWTTNDAIQTGLHRAGCYLCKPAGVGTDP